MKHRNLLRLFVLALPLVGALAPVQAKPATTRPATHPRTTPLDVRGDVVELQGRNALRLRTRGGRVVSVQTRDAIGSGVGRGDFVRARGSFDGSILHANSVTFLTDKGQGAQGDLILGQGLTFTATVRSIRNDGIEVQGPKGRSFDVHTNRVRFTGRVGDHVLVRGIARNGFIEATRISKAR